MSNPPAWDDQRIFLAVLEQGSLSAAARHLGLSHPTVRARIEGLEARLGTVLFTRSGSGLTPTPTAEALREPARATAMAADRFVRAASAPADALAGTVRLSVPDFMGIEVIPAMLARLQRAHPQISIEMVLSNAPANLLAQEVDVAVRTITPQQEALVARKVATIPLGFFASPDYLARRGHPASIAALDTHDFIGPDRQRGDLALVESLNLRGRIVLRTDSHPAMLSAARAGLGIAVAQVPVASADPRLARVLPGIVLAHLDTWLVTHENLARVPRVRAVLDTLAAAFREMV